MHKIFMIFFFLRFISAYAESSLEACLKGSDAEKCNMISGQFRADQNYIDAYSAEKKSCELQNDQGCNGMYSDSGHLSSDIQKESLQILKDICKKNESLCDTLGRYYEDNKEYENAIIYSKKAFLVNKNGIYPYFEYLYGNKVEGFKQTLQNCKALEKNYNSPCVFYVRYMPDHPQLADLVKSSEHECLKGKTSAGATVCAILGTYYSSRGNKSKAIEMWTTDCRRGVRSTCLLLIGSTDTSNKQKQKAAHNFCNSKSQFIEAQENLLLSDQCPKLKKNFIPPEILIKAKVLLKSYLETQK